MKTLFFENVTSRIGEHIISSDVRPATEEEIKKAELLNIDGKCPHNIVYDESGWLYDERHCATCGKGLGLI